MIILTDDASQTLSVLLVEDSKILGERIGEALRQMDEVNFIGIVETEDDAVALISREAVDVVILDLHLKQGSGFGVMRELAVAPMKPQIIVLTNYDLPQYKQSALDLGATHFLDKARDFGLLPVVLHEIQLGRKH